MQSELDVVVIGNIVSDFLAGNVPEKFKWGEHIVVENPISLNLGGNGGIFSIVASRLGLRTGINSIVGNDVFGGILLEKFIEYGINIQSIKIAKDLKTSATLGIATKNGERTLYHYIGASQNFNKNCLDFNLISKSKLVHLCAYYVMPKLEGEPTIEIFKRCKKNGKIVSFDIVSDPKNKWEIEDILKYVNIFLPNEDEAFNITKEEKPEKMAQSLLDMGISIAIITMGSNGCFGVDKDSAVRIPAFKINAVDSTGAGDCFAAGFAYATLQPWELEKKLKFANAVGAISVTKVGGVTSAPTLNEVNNFMKNVR